MDIPHVRKLRWLYVLALAQLVGGPLVLLQLTFFCKLTLHELPQVGIARAAMQVWDSDDFQCALTGHVSGTSGETKSNSPARDAQVEGEKSKLPVIPWSCERLARITPPPCAELGLRVKFWTPAWSQAPPGPPPKVG